MKPIRIKDKETAYRILDYMVKTGSAIVLFNDDERFTEFTIVENEYGEVKPRFYDHENGDWWTWNYDTRDGLVDSLLWGYRKYINRSIMEAGFFESIVDWSSRLYDPFNA